MYSQATVSMATGHSKCACLWFTRAVLLVIMRLKRPILGSEEVWPILHGYTERWSAWTAPTGSWRSKTTSDMENIEPAAILRYIVDELGIWARQSTRHRQDAAIVDDDDVE